MVGAAGFEPATTSPPDWCATRLRHAPTGVGSLAPSFSRTRNEYRGGDPDRRAYLPLRASARPMPTVVRPAAPRIRNAIGGPPRMIPTIAAMTESPLNVIAMRVGRRAADQRCERRTRIPPTAAPSVAAPAWR